MRSPASSRVLQDRTFLFVVIVVSVAFIWILLPFYAAVFWAVVLAILFTPLYRRLARAMGQRRTWAALATLLIILLLVILPSAFITGLLVQEGVSVYQRIQSGQLNFAAYLQQVLNALPSWATGMLNESGMMDLGALQERVSKGLMSAISFVAAHAVSVGQNTLDFIVGFFIMLYLLFFLLRDGALLSRRVRDAIPLQEDLERDLIEKFARVTRATIKGSFVVAIVQGALGGLIFWILGVHAPVLWGVVMGFLSLLPAVGTALIWLPVAIYLLVSGDIWQGIVLIGFGVLVIGMVDNVLRPILVGKDTKLPDYVVLIATLGGMAIFGLNGFVIGPIIAALFIAVWDVVATSNAGAPIDGAGS